MATWIGVINDKWSEPLNWDTSAIPSSGEYVSFWGQPNAVVDIDMDVVVDYLNLDSNILSFNMNDKTIQCNDFNNNTSAANVINCGTSTLIIGSSANPANEYVSANLKSSTYYKIITYNNCSFRPTSTTSFYNTSGVTKILHSLECHNKIRMNPSYPNNKTFLDCPLIDLSDCIIMESGSSDYWKIFKYGTTVISREDGVFTEKTAFVMNASADNQIIQLPSSNGYNSNAALILSPKDFITQQVYSNVTFVAPASANYGICGSKYLFEEHDGSVLTGGLYSVSSTIDFEANDSVVRTDVLNLTGCNLKLSTTSDLYVDRKLDLYASTITYNPANKIVFDAQYRKAFGSADKMFNISINTDASVVLPDVYIKMASNILGSFRGSSFFYEGTPNEIVGLTQGCNFGAVMNLSGDATFNNFYGQINGSVSANTFILSGYDNYQSQILKTFNLTQTSGSIITNCYVSSFFINSGGTDVSGIDIYSDPYYGRPTKLVPIDEIVYAHNIWTNSGGDNLWSNGLNWSLGQIQENHIASFDKNISSATCIIDMDVGSVYGISAKPYATTYNNSNWHYYGVLRFAENSKIRISRFADFSRFINLEVVNQNTANLDYGATVTDVLSNRVLYGFNVSQFTGMQTVLPNINVFKKSLGIINTGNILKFCKNLNVHNKICSYTPSTVMFSVGTSSNTSSGACNLYAPNATVIGSLNLLNTSLNIYGNIEKPIYGKVLFNANNISTLQIPNIAYPFGVGLGISQTSIINTTFTFAPGSIPNITEVNFASSSGAAIIDLQNFTKFGNINFGGFGSGVLKSSAILPNTDFEVARLPDNYLVTIIGGVNSKAILTNAYLPNTEKPVELYAPPSQNEMINIGVIISGSDKIINFSSKAKVRSFSAIGCSLFDPYNAYLNTDGNGIYTQHGILISGCKTSGGRAIDGKLHLPAGYLSYFEPSAFVLSGSKVEIIETDFFSHAWNFLVYSTVSPSAINMNMRGGTAVSTSGDARFATNLGSNINWKFVDQKLYSVFPQEGTSWFRRVLLSGSDLDSANIYFDGELITNFDILTPSSAICTVPIRSAGNYNFILG